MARRSPPTPRLTKSAGRDGSLAELGKLMALTAQDADGGQDRALGLPGVPAAMRDRDAPRPRGAVAGGVGGDRGRERRHAAQAARWSTAAAAAAGQGLKLRGRKPNEPFAALARAETDHAVAEQRLTDAQTLQERKRPRRGGGRSSPGACRIKRHTDALDPRPGRAGRTPAKRSGHATPTARASERHRSRQPDHENQERVGPGLQRPSDRQPAPDRARLRGQPERRRRRNSMSR